MTYYEKICQIQKRIDAKSKRFMALDLKIHSHKVYLDPGLNMYNQLKWEMTFLNTEMETVYMAMRINKKNLADEFQTLKDN